MKETVVFAHLDIFADILAAICSRTPFANNRLLYWTVIANPTAGGFTIRRRWEKSREILEICRTRASRISPRVCPAQPSQTALRYGGNLGRNGLIPTTGPGHASEIVKEVIAEAALGPESGETSPFYFIITAGGDGTSLEALTALYQLPESLKSRFVILRLPMGTGNDGAESWSLDGALDRLLSPGSLTFSKALRLSTSTPGKGPFLAFNILSAGLDAFVTDMTNKMKRYMPGDSYKFWVDVAALFYDRVYRVGEMDIEAFDEKGGLVKAVRDQVLLLAMGVTGKRTYGSHKWILPDERNVCAVKQMPLLRKITLKDLFTTGAHVHKPESILFNAAKVTFRTENPILAQMDGEAILLETADFPVTIELTEPVIPVLTLAE